MEIIKKLWKKFDHLLNYICLFYIFIEFGFFGLLVTFLIIHLSILIMSMCGFGSNESVENTDYIDGIDDINIEISIYDFSNDEGIENIDYIEKNI